MNEFMIVTVIARPVDEVFAVLTDLERMPLWVPGMTEASVTSDGPLKAVPPSSTVEPFSGAVWRCPSSALA